MGNIIATLKQTNSLLTSESIAKGSLNLKFAKSFGLLGGAKGNAEIEVKQNEEIQNYDLEIGLVGVYLDTDPEVKVPVTVREFSDKVMTAGRFIKEGVPYTIELTPLRYYPGLSVALMYDAISEAELEDIKSSYNKMMGLANGLYTLFDRVQNVGQKNFPKFCSACRNIRDNYDLLIGKIRGSLGILLQEHAEDSPDRSQKIKDFLSSTLQSVEEYEKILRDRKRTFHGYVNMVQLAKDNGFPMGSLTDIESAIFGSPPKPTALMIVPSKARLSELKNFYLLYPPKSDTVETVTKFECFTILAEVADPEESSSETLISAADPALRTSLGALDWDDHALLQAFDKFIATNTPVLALYGFPSLLRDPSWTRYHAIFHWEHRDRQFLCRGTPDGYGQSWEKDGEKPKEEGVFLNGALNDSASLVRVTAYNGNIPEQSAVFAIPGNELVGHDPSTEALRAVLSAQLAKGANVMGWKSDIKRILRSIWDVPQRVKDIELMRANKPAKCWRTDSATYVEAQGGRLIDVHHFELHGVPGFYSPWINGYVIYGPDHELKVISSFMKINDPVLISAKTS
ncbi:hypothetical protein LTR84_008130 [Exophiala bonariae]|uniref:Uncharacterized protein n=1 Tax=Exophiala bonariae TaxID=1690606 RepID=A0AAV9NM20_9EURO|nr:hypothetical protein LTR84_008130 [Exophiala bonariae]